jgi:hypothetical protein
MIESEVAVNGSKRHAANPRVLAVPAKPRLEISISAPLMYSTPFLNKSQHTSRPVGSQHVDCDDILSSYILGIFDDEVIFPDEADPQPRLHIG